MDLSFRKCHRLDCNPVGNRTSRTPHTRRETVRHGVCIIFHIFEYMQISCRLQPILLGKFAHPNKKKKDKNVGEHLNVMIGCAPFRLCRLRPHRIVCGNLCVCSLCVGLLESTQDVGYMRVLCIYRCTLSVPR